MSHQLRLRDPAWSGFSPAPGSFRPACGPVPTEIGLALGMTGRVLARSTASGQAERFYQFFPASDHPPLFLKIVDEQRLATQLEADRIATWLDDRGVPVNRMLAGFPRPLTGGRYLLGSELIDGLPAGKDASILPKLGRVLAQTHRHLRALPWADRVRETSEARDRAFRQNRDSILHRSRLDAGLRSVMRADGTDLPAEYAQVLHGDLNLGNVLFRPDDQGPVLLDFEDAVHNSHSVSVDLAMVIERFILVRQLDDAQALAASAQLLSGYREISDPVWPSLGLAGVLRALSIRALVLLNMDAASADRQAPNRQESNRREQDKFIRLFRQTDRRSKLLAKIESL